MNKNKTVTTVIIANGRFPSHPVPLSCIREAEYIICCDGAANDFIARGGVPDAIVGDCDSISEENKIRFADILHPNPDQETNDLTKSVQFCVENGRQEIIIVGGTGKREDHTLGNISLLADYAELAEVIMVTNWGIFTPIHSITEFKSYKGEQVSIFSIDPKKLTTHNLKYPVEGRILTNWWQGSLNESLGDSFSIDPEGRVIVFQAYKQ
ncbi:thiamine pyrophosphokinase [Proteiniphilum saccharofermentans]|uniref:Thiamine diphosphokinase n=1 Tax=Proteiniphilum saccharofermentans TaxID=1642647 RepID=A0A1R3SYI5_9BACT|nr:thiamine diphosphokinase [Proteiniphilum saccharofermentans]SCD21256.1 thiamine pyrophosphokinase [Proteiniphilum saccharofermentans]SDZ85551.1 thiamine diphosphokinase [Porphyromonadaceae bacterium KH3R12]SFT00952.1 thiamine diphosphokinase [Porphyromonadaceae bacterium NLAE-zl-C104]